MRRSALGTLALSALLLAGCSEDPQLKTTPDPTETPSTSAAASEPSSSAPKRETAEQFIPRWMRLFDSAADTGHTRNFERLNAPGCRSCKSFLKVVKTVYRAGGDIKQKPAKVLWIRKVKGSMYDVRRKSDGSQMQPTPGSDWIVSKGGTYTMRVELRRVGASWKVSQYASIAGSQQ